MIIGAITAIWLIASGPQHVSVDAIVQTTCITAAVYTEAEGEPYRGKLAVAAVVRARAARASSTACAVVTARHQFSGLARRIDRLDAKALVDAIRASLVSHRNPAPVPECAGATHFDNSSGVWWTREFPRVCSIGRHDFYQEPTT